MRFCKNCGRFAADPAQTHCLKCGEPLPPLPPQPVSRPEEKADAVRPLYHRQTPEAGMTTVEYFFTLLVFSIPLVGLILQLVWSFSGTEDPARRNLSRAYLLRKLIGAVLLTAAAAFLTVVVWSVLSSGAITAPTPYYW